MEPVNGKVICNNSDGFKYVGLKGVLQACEGVCKLEDCIFIFTDELGTWEEDYNGYHSNGQVYVFVTIPEVEQWEKETGKKFKNTYMIKSKKPKSLQTVHTMAS